MKKKTILYLLIVLIICFLLIFGYNLLSNREKKENVVLRDCQTQDEVLKALENISLYMKVDEVRELLGNENGDVGSGLAVHLYKINDMLSVTILYDIEYRVNSVHLRENGESREIQLEYKRIDDYDGLKPEEAFDKILENYDYKYIENKNYFLVKGVLRDAEEFGKSKLIYVNDKWEYFDYIYENPNSDEFFTRRYIDLEVDGLLFKVEFCEFQKKCIIRIDNAAYDNTDISILDYSSNFSKLEFDSNTYWLNVLDSIEPDYEIFVDINGEIKSLIKGSDMLRMLNK